MKKITGSVLACVIFAAASAASAEELAAGQITLTEFLGAGRDTAVSVRLTAAGEGREVSADDFYELADSMLLTSSLNPEQTDMDGVFITVETNKGEMLYAYVSAGGGADRYSAAMSRYPYALYTVSDSALLSELLEMAGVSENGRYTDGLRNVSEWAVPFVNDAYAAGLIPANLGADDITKPVTRGEFCDLALCVLERGGLITDVAAAGSAFADTDRVSVDILHSYGIINGRTETEFAPDDSITREEAALILFRMSAVMDIPNVSGSAVYRDMDETSDHVKEAVSAVTGMGIMNGIGETEFAPKSFYTTEQAIVTMLRMSKKL